MRACENPSALRLRAFSYRLSIVVRRSRHSDEASGYGPERGGGHRERTAEIKRAVQDRVEAARIQMELARAASRRGRGIHDEFR